VSSCVAVWLAGVCCGVRGGAHALCWKLSEMRVSRQVRTLTGHSGSVWSLAFSPDGKLVVSGSDDDTVKIWDVETGAVVSCCAGVH